jgi:hypothetical protein
LVGSKIIPDRSVRKKLGRQLPGSLSEVKITRWWLVMSVLCPTGNFER